MNSREARSYIKNHTLRSVVNDIWPLYRSKNAFFAMPREVYAYIDFLAKLNEGRDRKIVGMVNFIKAYFGPINPLYESFPYILTVMLRHGTFHHVSPKILNIGGLDVVAVIGRGKSADTFKFKGVTFNHLEPRDELLSDIRFWAKELNQFTTGRVRAIWIPISVKALYRDLKKAILNYRDELTEPLKVRKLERGMTLVTTPLTESQLRSRYGFNVREIAFIKRFIKTS